MFIVGTPTAIGVATFETIRGKNFFDTAGSVYEDFGQVANAIGKFGDSQSETLTRVVLGGVVSAVTGQAIDNIGDHIDHNGPHKT